LILFSKTRNLKAYWRWFEELEHMVTIFRHKSVGLFPFSQIHVLLPNEFFQIFRNDRLSPGRIFCSGRGEMMGREIVCYFFAQRVKEEKNRGRDQYEINFFHGIWILAWNNRKI
jgi:hypothetical protein